MSTNVINANQNKIQETKQEKIYVAKSQEIHMHKKAGFIALPSSAMESQYWDNGVKQSSKGLFI